jgi:CHAT domain-containing protein
VGSLALMGEFYDQLTRTPTRAEALRQAQLALINGTVRIESKQLSTGNGALSLPAAIAQPVNLRHPFYWSAFTLIGNPW